MLAAALRARAESFGAQVHTGVTVEAVLVQGSRATGVRLADGSVVRAERAVLADVTAPSLYSHLLADATCATFTGTPPRSR